MMYNLKRSFKISGYPRSNATHLFHEGLYRFLC